MKTVLTEGFAVRADVTSVLAAISNGDSRASEQLLPLVYNELRQLARRQLAHERPGHTLQATALVHEAYIRLLGPASATHCWNSRNHFLCAAAEAMRRILIEAARRKKALKRGGGQPTQPLDEVDSLAMPVGTSAEEFLSLDEALEKLELLDPAKAVLVKLRYFTGLSIEETASVLGISRATVVRHWDFARSWLYVELSRSRCSDG